MGTKEWQPSTIGEMCAFSSGHGFSSRDWSTSGWPIIRIGHLNGSRAFDYFDGNPEPDWIVEPGELLFAWAGTRGVSFGPTVWDGPKGVLNQHIYRVRANEGIDPAWLFYALELVTARIERKAHGFKSTLLHVRKADITGQKCLVPPPDEQRRIVAILDLWGRAGRQLQSLVAAKKRLKKGFEQKLLAGQLRSPRFRDRWVTRPLSDLLSEKAVTNKARSVALVYSCTKTQGIVPQAERFGKQLASADLGRYKIVEPGDLVYDPMLLWDGSLGFLGEGSERGLVSPAYATFEVDEDRADRGFLDALLRSHRLAHRFGQISQGTNQRRRKAHPKDFLKTEVDTPGDLKEQQWIANLLQLFDREIELFEEELRLSRLQKRRLLQEMLSGQVRPPIPPNGQA